MQAPQIFAAQGRSYGRVIQWKFGHGGARKCIDYGDTDKKQCLTNELWLRDSLCKARQDRDVVNRQEPQFMAS